MKKKYINLHWRKEHDKHILITKLTQGYVEVSGSVKALFDSQEIQETLIGWRIYYVGYRPYDDVHEYWITPDE